VRQVYNSSTIAAASTMHISHRLPAYVSAIGTQIQHFPNALLSLL